MIDDRLISETELHSFLPGHSLAGEAQALLLQQCSTWDLARIGYKSLELVKARTFDFDGVAVRIQCNPGRLKSTTAKVDRRSVQDRPCFLCDANLPPEQKGILYRDDYLILVNPYPIFPEHFSVAHVRHLPQRILPEAEILFDLARDLSPEFVVLYNGPRSGASAPDHLHFQAGTKSFLPLVDEYQNVRARFGRLVTTQGDLQVYGVDRYQPAFLAMESPSLRSLMSGFTAFHAAMALVVGTADEPMMNLLCWFEEGEWRLVIFPRAKHRPDRFFATGGNRILISPASIDLGGVGVIPVDEDFARVTKEDIEAIFDEVTVPAAQFRDITSALADMLNR